MKNWIGLLILVILAAIAWIVIADIDLLPSDKVPLKDFAIEDTAKVDKIFIAEPSGKRIVLSRRESAQWMVEGRYPARPDAIKLILKTLHDIKVLSNVSKTSMPRTISRMASSSKKVEFYMDGEKSPEKIWYIGDGTFSRVGTYMLLEKNGKKSSEPFITHLLMERGTLNSRFFADSILWKDRVVFKSDPKEIAEIKLIHKYDTATSYAISQQENASFVAKNLESGETTTVNPEIAIQYFKGFSAIYYEYLDVKSSNAHLDSIYTSAPRHQIEIKMKDGREFSMKTFNMPVKEGATLPNGDSIDFNPERMYVYSSYMRTNFRPIVQNLTFDQVISDYTIFDSSTTVEK